MARRQLSFTGLEPTPPKSSKAPLCYEHIDGRGAVYTWRFAELGNRLLARDMANYFGPLAHSTFDGLRSTTVQCYADTWNRFARSLKQPGRNTPRSLIDLTRADLDHVDQPGRYNDILIVVSVLRAISSAHPTLLSIDLVARLNYCSKHTAKGLLKPREPISQYVSAQLLKACDSRIHTARQRITAGRALIAELTAKAELTRIEQRILAITCGAHRKVGDVSGRPWAKSGWSVGSIGSGVALTPDDAAAFTYAIGLRVEMPIECIHDLRRNCLSNTSGGFVDVEYMKGRGGPSAAIRRERVRDGGLSTPGGILRLVLDLTAHAAKQLDEQLSDVEAPLWVGFHINSDGNAFRRIAFAPVNANKLVASFNIVDDTGTIVTRIDRNRLRKTAKRDRYRSFGGHLRRFANDHTVSVAQTHYARVDALEEDHKSSIEAALHSVYGNAMTPLVLTPIEEAQARDNGAVIAGSLLDAATVSNLLGGNVDTWLTSCADFHNSPFGSDEKNGCRAPLSACLHCRNSVFTERKLPAVMSYLAWIEERRSFMSEERWASDYASDRFRILHQILPRFAVDVVERARAMIPSTGTNWIPLSERRI